jgi:hypothetical protein
MESDIFSRIEPRGILRSAEIAGKAGEEIEEATGLKIRLRSRRIKTALRTMHEPNESK